MPLFVSLFSFAFCLLSGVLSFCWHCRGGEDDDDKQFPSFVLAPLSGPAPQLGMQLHSLLCPFLWARLEIPGYFAVLHLDFHQLHRLKVLVASISVSAWRITWKITFYFFREKAYESPTCTIPCCENSLLISRFHGLLSRVIRQLSPSLTVTAWRLKKWFL